MAVGNEPSERAQAGTVVEVRMEGDDETSLYLVGSIEEKGRGYDVISPGSPLGTALLGHSVGDVVDYEAPARVLKVEIIAIEG